MLQILGMQYRTYSFPIVMPDRIAAIFASFSSIVLCAIQVTLAYSDKYNNYMSIGDAFILYTDPS